MLQAPPFVRKSTTVLICDLSKVSSLSGPETPYVQCYQLTSPWSRSLKFSFYVCKIINFHIMYFTLLK